MLTFQNMYDTYSADIYRFSFSLCGNQHEAEDITSETFVRAWACKNTIRVETLKAYLFTIARNIFLEQKRRQKRSVSLEDVHIDTAPLPDISAGTQLKLQQVYNVLSRLPEVDRTVFLLRVQHDLPYAEIARVLQLSLAAVKVKIHRIRKKIIMMCADKEVD